MTESSRPEVPLTAAQGPASPVFAAPRDWARMHPVSPILKAWPAVLGVGAWWFYTGGPSWLGGGGSDEDIPSGFRLSIWALIGLAILAAIVAVGFSYIAWRANRFRITDDAIEQHKGVLFRQQRHARLDRLQAVDVVQPLVARIFGFAKVSIEVAGGEDSSVSLEFLRLGDAEALRNEIVALAAGRRVARAQAIGADAASGVRAPNPALSPADINPLSSRAVATEVAADVQREVYTVPLGRLVESLLRSWGALWAAALIPVTIAVVIAASQNTTFRQALLGVVGGSVAGVIGALTGIGAYVFAMVNRGFNFRAAVADDGIRLRHGLLETRRQTVPPGRVQAVRLRQSLLWRRKDWWHITINVAGYQQNQEAVSTLLPVGPRDEALLALQLVFPHLGDPSGSAGEAAANDDEHFAATLTFAMEGKGADGGFTASPRSARLVDPLQWRHRGVAATERALIIRRGLLTREVFIVPHERTQSLRVSQGPVQRALSLASVEVQSTVGPVRPAAHHLGVGDAVTLLEEQARRARQRRKVQTPEQWALAVQAIGTSASDTSA